MKKGIIIVSNELYSNDYSLISILFNDFRPTHIEFRHWENDTWYLYGVSDKFESLKEGDAIPKYDVLFTMHPNGTITYEFMKHN